MAEINLGRVKGDPGPQGIQGIQGPRGPKGDPGTGIDVVTEPVIYIPLRTLAALTDSNKYNYKMDVKTYGGWTLELDQPSIYYGIKAGFVVNTNNTNNVKIVLSFPQITEPVRTLFSLTGTLKKSGNADIPFERIILII